MFVLKSTHRAVVNDLSADIADREATIRDLRTKLATAYFRNEKGQIARSKEPTQ